MYTLFLALISLCSADLYMMNPRGSVDRLNETNTNRNNDNRMFDSQDNAKGGFCWGPPMHYYVGSVLSVEWTNQHECNGESTDCQIIVQYMCDPQLRDGMITDTIPNDATTYNTQVPIDPSFGTGGVDYLYGMHESYDYYQNCSQRQRNKGLYIADRNLGADTAIFTRQNNNGQRFAFECTEERDYYPYWHPAPWKDIAVLTSRMDICGLVTSDSGNVQSKHLCSDPTQNNDIACQGVNGQWFKVDANGGGAPVCIGAPISRDNHLGNAMQPFMGNVNAMYNWTVADDANDHCALRLRYNISSRDWDGYFGGIDSKFNGNNALLKNNPTISYGADFNFTLALNTAQYFRTFQDRSFMFSIQPRPSSLTDTARIYNLNLRGKRGNIVQTYPATEYDFAPNTLNVRQGDYVHFQWTGCDFEPQGNDGQGTTGTDRANIVRLNAKGTNTPNPQANGGYGVFSMDDLINLAMIGQTGCLSYAQLVAAHGSIGNADQDPQNCFKLNANPSGYFDGGLTEITSDFSFTYMSTRENNFTNRSHKARINASLFIAPWAIAMSVIGGLIFLGGVGVAGALVYAKRNPQSNVANFFSRM